MKTATSSGGVLFVNSFSYDFRTIVRLFEERISVCV
jgi:hypothetical protein